MGRIQKGNKIYIIYMLTWRKEFPQPMDGLCVLPLHNSQFPPFRISTVAGFSLKVPLNSAHDVLSLCSGER